MLKPRTAKEDLSNIPLLLRVKSYINNMLNLKYLEKPLSGLDDDLNALFSRKHIPSNTVRRIQHWIDKIKGYRQEKTTLENVLRGFQRNLHRAITVRPKLWVRNLFQSLVTPPYKLPMLHPRTIGARLGKLPQKAIDYFYENTSQYQAMKREYLYFLEGTGQTHLPLEKQFTGLAEQVGSVYPLTDLWNRDRVYSKTFEYVKPYIDDYKAGKIDLQKLKNNTGYHSLKTYEQRHFLKLLDKDPLEAACWLADWNSNNSQWKYKMKERSLEELTTNTPAFFNLFVWPKGMAQLTFNLANKANPFSKAPWEEKRSGTVALIGLFLMADLSRRILNGIYGRYKTARYSGYNVIESMFWTLGGATISEINDLMDAYSNLVYTYQYGDSKEKKRALQKALKITDGASRLFIPFFDPLLALTEALTNTEYISPLYNLFYKKSKYIHRNILQKMQHTLFRQVRYRKPMGEFKLRRYEGKKPQKKYKLKF
jgi:hypothetical protein